MSHTHQGPLATYNSLTDDHLSGYFSNDRMRRHLRKAGLVSKQGEIVSESTYRLNMSRKEHKKQVKDMLAQAIVHKTLDLERVRQAEIKKKLEEISKIQLVRRVRASTGRKGDEDVLPYLTSRSRRPGSSPAFKPKGQTTQSKLRPNSAPGVRSESRHSQISVEEEGDVLYLDDDGRPITPANLPGEQSHIDPRHLHTLDTAAIRKYAMLMSQMEEGRGVTSPYLMSQVPLPPKARLSRPVLSSRRVQSASPKRPITTDSRIARLHRPETAKVHPGDQQTMCRVLMKYHGWTLNLAREKMDPTQEVVVEQQHCGGNTLTVFKERLTPGSTFEFISYRHRGYPFSLTMYLDGQMDSRVSTCCEYRHSRGARIGGKQGHFSLLSVEGAIPCYKCQVAKGVLVRNKATPRKAKRPSERHMEEVIVVATKRDDDDDVDDDNLTDGRTRRAKLVGEDEGGVVIAVERDEEENEGKTPKSPAERDTTYDDDFDDDKSASSRSSSASYSESETESSSRKDEVAKRGKSGREHFQPQETRGEESEGASPTPLPVVEEEEEERGGGDAWRARRVEVNGTGREIDDYSSDNDEDDQKVKVINMENVEADNQRMTHDRSRASSSSSHSSSPNANNNVPPEEERGTDNAIISVDLVDREERDQENARKERQRREEERQREEEEFLQEQQRKREEKKEAERRAAEARRQEEAYHQQLLEAEQQKKEKRRRLEEEKQFSQSQRVEEEKTRQITMVLEEPDTEYENPADPQHESDARHEEKFDIEKSEESEHQSQPEEDSEESTQDSPSYVQEVQKDDKEEEDSEVQKDDEDEEDSEQLKEEKSSSHHSESSTARSLSPAVSSASSCAESTPREEPPKERIAQEDDGREPMKSPSPPPSDADMALLEPKQTADDDMAPPRVPSPFPSPAVYLDRRQARTKDEAHPSRPESPPMLRPLSPVPPRSESTVSRPLSPVPPRSESLTASEQPPRATSPFPAAAVYIDRPKRQASAEANAEQQQDTARSNATETSHSLASTALSTTAYTSDSEDDQDTRNAELTNDSVAEEGGEEDKVVPVQAGQPNKDKD